MPKTGIQLIRNKLKYNTNMSIPLHLASIKSSGVYSFVWDKSQVPIQQAETLRLVLGYSERGPFNTPVYINSKTDFVNTYGKASKRLERKGVYFHRIATQALGNGPILAFNLKPFDSETVKAQKSDDLFDQVASTEVPVTTLYDTTKFWTLDPDHLPEMTGFGSNYFILSASDSTENDVTVFIRKTPQAYLNNYHIQINSWFNNESLDEMPLYLDQDGIRETYLDDYFMDIYVYRGHFTDAVKSGSLKKYFYPSEAEFNTLWTGTADGTGTTGIKKQVKDAITAAAIPGFAASSITDVDSALTMVGELNTAAGNAEANSDSSDDDTAAAERELATTIDNLIAPLLVNAGTNNETVVTLYGKIREDYKNAFGEDADVLAAMARDANSRFVGFYRGIIFPYFRDANGNYISIDVVLNADYDAHKLIMKLNEPLLDASQTPLTTFAAKTYNENIVVDGITTPVYNQGIMEYDDITGYTYATISSTDDATQILTKCMNVLNTKGIHEALTNRVDVEYHYIIDGFKAYGNTAQAEQHAKLAALAQDKQNAFAMINFPAIKDFGTEVINSTTHTVDMNAVVQKFPLAGEDDGASFCGYFTPVLFSDGTLKNTVPSVGLISNNFMEKFGARQPYYIVAGPTYGRLSATGMVGPDYGFSRAELDILEPAGINAIIYTPRLGTYVNSNQTAKQAPVSALSKIHVRELVIYLTDEIANLLQNYQWELNTQELRDTVKAKADSILETVQNNGGVYDFLNICDSTNNTPEIIDNEMFVLSTSIEPARGAGKMIHELTLYRTGEISSTIR